MLARSSQFVACALLAVRTAFAIPTIEIKGSKFFTSDGDQFYIKGVAYQPGMLTNLNGLTNGDQCKIDAKLIGELGANVVRVYSVDPTLNHDACMNAFAENGIYVIVDMSTPTYSINRVNPKWTLDLRNAFAQVIDGFQGYDNVLGFFAGNEIINDQSTTSAAPFAKAVVADMKAYRDLMQYRKIPIGYSSADATVRLQVQDYFDCGNESIAVDFFGFNNYAWCGDSSMDESGYTTLYDDADGYDIPIFLSETGCSLNLTGGRPFTDQVAMLGREMNDRYSGNIIYEWSEEGNGYGLVSYTASAATGTPSIMGDYKRLQSQWATLSPTGIKASAYDPTLTRRDCPASTSSSWIVRKDASLPTLGTSGFTAPTGPRSTTSGGVLTGSLAGGDAVQTTGSQSGSAIPGNSNASSKTPVGAIAGGVLGGLVGLALILGAILYFLRRKREQRAAYAGVEQGGPNGAPPGKLAMNPDEEKDRQNGYYGPRYHEMSGNGTTQELDPARGHVAAMPAPEMASRGEGRPELAEEGQGHYPAASLQSDFHAVGTSRGAGSAPGAEPSPYVQAQRRTELDWLESEEARLRQRREVLMRQDGGGGS